MVKTGVVVVNHIVTKQSMIKFLAERDSELVMHYIGRALVALFHRQVEDEKKSNDTHYDNSLGFSAADAKAGSITAKYYLKHGALLDWQIEKWTADFRGAPRITKYWKQLDEIARQKKGM